MTWDVFAAQMHRLRGLRFPPADFTTHWEALHELPEAVLEAAVSRAQKTREHFPTPVELRQDADAVAHQVRSLSEDEADRSVPAPAPMTWTLPNGATVTSDREWQYYDDRCRDSGWVDCWCGPAGSAPLPWLAYRICGRRRDHAPHQWVSPCACRESNPDVQRRRASQVKYASQRAGK